MVSNSSTVCCSTGLPRPIAKAVRLRHAGRWWTPNRQRYQGMIEGASHDTFSDCKLRANAEQPPRAGDSPFFLPTRITSRRLYEIVGSFRNIGQACGWHCVRGPCCIETCDVLPDAKNHRSCIQIGGLDRVDVRRVCVGPGFERRIRVSAEPLRRAFPGRSRRQLQRQ